MNILSIKLKKNSEKNNTRGVIEQEKNSFIVFSISHIIIILYVLDFTNFYYVFFIVFF